ncbi:hypothetical protein SKAU_G00127200 [Synaphobranchus kaupii]|uniref:Uncharacterized protein n=1 Tax=Synaphobranchus kaupii TaxID=118154 RepID=A0A9Q1J206_SYNKA|nr:hypothetical protein SKAU_G00127200 [Synaphobranchus kaupii]
MVIHQGNVHFTSHSLEARINHRQPGGCAGDLTSLTAEEIKRKRFKGVKEKMTICVCLPRRVAVLPSDRSVREARIKRRGGKRRPSRPRDLAGQLQSARERLVRSRPVANRVLCVWWASLEPRPQLNPHGARGTL